MQVILFKFSKRNNSTKQPTGGDNFDVKLKENTSVVAPILQLKESPVVYNYAYIPEFGRYYFITDWKYLQGIWNITLKIDVLASNKDTIGNTNCNILYASGSDKNIVDKRIPITGGITVSKTDHSVDGFVISGIANQGAVILGITGKGSFGQYLMKDSTRIKGLLNGVDDWWDIEAAGDAAKQMFYGNSAANCLKSAIALPVVIGGSDVGGSEEEIYLGGYPTGENGYHITKPIYRSTTTVSIPWKYSDWRRNNPYSEVILYLPFIGVVSLPTSDLINDDSLAVQYSINVTSGDLAVSVRGATSNKIISTSSTNIAMATPYGSTGSNYSTMISSVTAGYGAVAAGAITISTGGAALPATLGIMGGLATAAAGTISGLGGNATGDGGLGGGATHGLDPVIHCYVVSRDLSDSQTNFDPLMGKPYMSAGYPKNFSGFVMTEGFSINAGISELERSLVNSAMDAGIYYE